MNTARGRGAAGGGRLWPGVHSVPRWRAATLNDRIKDNDRQIHGNFRTDDRAEIIEPVRDY